MSIKKTWLAFLILALLNLPGEIAAMEKTLKRTDDHVVMEGKVLEPLLGSRLDRLSLMACTDEGFRPVTFQLDEKNPDGEYVYKQGPAAGKDTDPLLDSNDELVFMADSIGPCCNSGDWPEGAKAGVGIKVSDPVDGGQGWLYLFLFDDHPPLSEVDLVSMDFSSEGLKIITPEFILGMSGKKGFPDELHIPGQDGNMGPDMLDRFKARAMIKLIGGIIKFDMKVDEYFCHEPIGWIDGPVRIILYAKGYIKIGFFKYDLPMNMMQFYYPNVISFPFYFTMEESAVMNFVSAIADVNVVAFLDCNEYCFGIHTYDSFNPYNPEVVFDGRMSQAEKNLNTTENLNWIVGYMPGIGASVNRIIMPREWSTITRELYYLEDNTGTDPPEDYPGIIGHGYKFKINLRDLKPGQYTYCQNFYFKKGFVPGDEKMILDILDHPLEVEAVKIEQP